MFLEDESMQALVAVVITCFLFYRFLMFIDRTCYVTTQEQYFKTLLYFLNGYLRHAIIYNGSLFKRCALSIDRYQYPGLVSSINELAKRQPYSDGAKTSSNRANTSALRKEIYRQRIVMTNPIQLIIHKPYSTISSLRNISFKTFQ